jgi:hypothetical protein
MRPVPAGQAGRAGVHTVLAGQAGVAGVHTVLQSFAEKILVSLSGPRRRLHFLQSFAEEILVSVPVH